GARLIDERERACDEHVLATGAAADAYAEGILNVCKRYLESPIACVSGVSGADLMRRIAAIMSDRVALRLNFGRKMALAAAATLAVALPLAAGMLIASTSATVAASPRRTESQTASQTQKFDVASVKLCAPDAPPSGRSQ